ncbi:MAG: hypothetical protein ABI577_11225 [bacterium]
MIPEIRHKLVASVLLSGTWYAVEGESYTQRGEMFVARLSGLPRDAAGGTAEVTGRLADVQAWRFKPASE